MMKRFFISIAVLGTILSSSFAQGSMDAYKLSRNTMTGTAHAIGMGGAFGALGGDITGVAINPAGIGVYKRSEIVTTMNFANVQTKTELNAGKMDDSKFKFSFDNLGYVGAFRLDNDDVPFINFGFTYNKIKSFDRKISMKGANLNSSLTDYITHITNSVGYTENQLDNTQSNYNPFNNVFDWMSILAYNSGLMNYNNGWQSFADQNQITVDNNYYLHEKGGINRYDFNVGTTISNVVSLGASVSITDVDYHLYSDYGENFGSTNNYFFLENFLKTEGSGYQFKVGAIVKPVNELRIGVAYHSPTWYEMTDYYGAAMTSGGSLIGDDLTIDTQDDRNARGAYTDYKLRAPDKWVFSLAGVTKRFIISADYELTNYGNMNVEDPDGRDFSWNPNSYIKRDFRSASTLRVGAEVRITPQFSGRVGYSWEQSPFKKETKNNENEIVTIGTVPQFTLDGDTNHFTWGLGYEFTNPNKPKTQYFYADVAFVIKNQESDLYMYDNSSKASLKTNTFQGLLTFGYKF